MHNHNHNTIFYGFYNKYQRIFHYFVKTSQHIEKCLPQLRTLLRLMKNDNE